MKVLVAVKRVVDLNVKISIKKDESGVDTTDVKMSMNPFDEIAVEAAVRFYEAGLASEVVAVSIGNTACKETLRNALAMGAERALLVETDAELQPLNVAKLLKEVAILEAPQLILLGKQAIDDDASQTGQMLAALLGWPQGTFASKLSLEKGRIIVVREVDDGTETIDLALPAIVTVDLSLNEPRYLSLLKIMMAKKKKIETLKAADLGVNIQPGLTTIRVVEPPRQKKCVKVKSAAELVKRLRNEAKVI